MYVSTSKSSRALALRDRTKRWEGRIATWSRLGRFRSTCKQQNAGRRGYGSAFSWVDGFRSCPIATTCRHQNPENNSHLFQPATALGGLDVRGFVSQARHQAPASPHQAISWCGDICGRAKEHRTVSWTATPACAVSRHERPGRGVERDDGVRARAQFRGRSRTPGPESGSTGRQCDSTAFIQPSQR